MDVKAAATRKIGPLPAWGWGVAIGGALLAFRLLRGGRSGGNGAEPDTILVPSGAPSIPHDYIGQLGQAMDEIRTRLSGLESGNPIQPPAPTGTTPPLSAKPIPYEQLGDYVIDLRSRFPVLHTAWVAATGLKPGIPGVYPGETAEQREARLRAEARFFETGAISIPAPSAGSVGV